MEAEMALDESGVEIERKFLVKPGTRFDHCDKSMLDQGYLMPGDAGARGVAPAVALAVEARGIQDVLVIRAATPEFALEVPLPAKDARALREDLASRCVRVRLSDSAAWLTLKGKRVGIRCPELEYRIAPEAARAMLEHLCVFGRLTKTRHRVRLGGFLWEVDVFHGKLAGLVMAEVELASEADRPMLPDWAAAEVSEDPRYTNAWLARADAPPTM